MAEDETEGEDRVGLQSDPPSTVTIASIASTSTASTTWAAHGKRHACNGLFRHTIQISSLHSYKHFSNNNYWWWKIDGFLQRRRRSSWNGTGCLTPCSVYCSGGHQSPTRNLSWYHRSASGIVNDNWSLSISSRSICYISGFLIAIKVCLGTECCKLERRNGTSSSYEVQREKEHFSRT